MNSSSRDDSSDDSSDDNITFFQFYFLLPLVALSTIHLFIAMQCYNYTQD